MGSREHWVAVREDRAQQNVRCFGTFTSDLEALAGWLKECRLTIMPMEATSGYWIPLFQLLERPGLPVRTGLARTGWRDLPLLPGSGVQRANPLEETSPRSSPLSTAVTRGRRNRAPENLRCTRRFWPIPIDTKSALRRCLPPRRHHQQLRAARQPAIT